MAGIVEYLQQILSARYGRDVRQAIHDGIQQCYYDGKAGGVDLEARQDIEKIEADTAEVKQSAENMEASITEIRQDIEKLNTDFGGVENKILALSGKVCPIKTITATSNTSGIVIVGTNETPLSVICDTGGYYVGRLFKTTDGFWFATIFDVSTAQPVTSEIEVTLVATMNP
jgi:hypothetical protein